MGIKQLASDIHFVKFIIDQMGNSGPIRYRKMFGDYAIYCKDKVVALVYDDQLFVKPTKAGRSFIGHVIEAPAYPGAKLSFLIEDHPLIYSLILVLLHSISCKGL
jgi:TfoX/Sxy family transcriptional regulator of competence genes